MPIRAWIFRRDGIIQRRTFSSRKEAQKQANYLPETEARKLRRIKQKEARINAILNYLRLKKRADEPTERTTAAPAPGEATEPREGAEPVSRRNIVDGDGSIIRLSGAETVFQRREISGRSGAFYTTWFRAQGTMGNLDEMKGESPSLLKEYLDDYAAPAAFYSNQSGLLNQVKFRGRVPLSLLIDKLNRQLQFIGEESEDFDFRTAYSSWSYKYQVVEHLGPTDTVILEIRGSSRGG